MIKKKVIGIKREEVFSPNHVANDSAIIGNVALLLRDKGLNVEFPDEKEFTQTDRDICGIFSMSRNKSVLQRIKSYEDKGIPAVNSAYGVENCFRTGMTQKLLENDVPYPISAIVSADEDASDAFRKVGEKNFWIKRGDFHAIHKEDVCFAHSIDEGNMILKEFGKRGIENVVISEHLYGDIIKFYAVRETGFFYWFYPHDVNHVKFDYCETDSKSEYFSFSENDLKQIADKAATVLDVDIYGGDAIISASGDIKIIDLNDWPSFAPCRDVAAVHIADHIYKTIIKN